MKRKVFFDSNIYLKFFEEKDPDKNKGYKTLFKNIKKIQNDIFITDQVINEINRNKLNKYLEKLADRKLIFSLICTHFPEHFDSQYISEISKWNKKNDKLKELYNTQQKKLTTIIKNIGEKIIEGKDEVSLFLTGLHKQMSKSTKDLIGKAKERNFLGNPPGKGHKIGDELNWEHILCLVKDIDEIWIVSHDGDYYDSFNKEKRLKPFLGYELKQLNKTLKVYCFDTLAGFFEEYKNVEKKLKSSLPTKNELQKIKDEETLSTAYTNNYIPMYHNDILYGSYDPYSLTVPAAISAVDSIRNNITTGSSVNSSFLLSQPSSLYQIGIPNNPISFYYKKQCPECSSSVDSDAIYCSVCGHKF